MTSRAKFSFGAFFRFRLLSRYSSIAGSRAIACSSSRKLPSACSRMVWFCWIMWTEFFTSRWLLVKCPAQNSVIFSSTGACVVDHPVDPPVAEPEELRLVLASHLLSASGGARRRTSCAPCRDRAAASCPAVRKTGSPLSLPTAEELRSWSTAASGPRATRRAISSGVPPKPARLSRCSASDGRKPQPLRGGESGEEEPRGAMRALSRGCWISYE